MQVICTWNLCRCHQLWPKGRENKDVGEVHVRSSNKAVMWNMRTESWSDSFQLYFHICWHIRHLMTGWWEENMKAPYMMPKPAQI